MALDVYQPCPCGSGKKLKFCCQEIGGEMEKVLKLQENNQNRAALQSLNRLEKSHPGNAWVATTRAAILMGEQQFAEARDILHTLIENHPDHAYGLVLYATAAFLADGYDASKAVLHRAFQRCIGTRPGSIGDLAFGIGSWMRDRGRWLAARAHLALAMRLAQSEDRQEEVFLNLLDLDGDTGIPYPLRSVHPLAEYAPDDEERQSKARNAERLCNVGCWGPAARLYARLAEQDPDNPALWQNVGLCRAWDGNERAAAEALHRSAGLQSDGALAVELETIAQLLDRATAEDRIPQKMSRYPVQSVSQLLTRLGESDRVRQVKVPPHEETTPQPAGVFEVLEFPLPKSADPQSLTRDALPRISGQLAVYQDYEVIDGPAAFLTGFKGDLFEDARNLFEETAGELVEPGRLPDGEDDEEWAIRLARRGIPREFYPLHERRAYPDETPGVVQQRLEEEKWSHVLDEIWPETPLPALDGKSPSQAAGDPALKFPLTGTLYVLDAYCQKLGYPLDLDSHFERFQLEPLQPLPVTEDLSISTLSPMQLHRLRPSELNDDQLFHALNRALLIQHSRFEYDVLTETLRRPSLEERIDLDQAYSTLVNLCQKRHRREEALEWVDRGRQHAQTRDQAFERSLQWTFRELMIRLTDPDDPELKPLLKRMDEQYLRKVPQLRDSVTPVVRLYGITPPWESGEIVTGSESGLWTPAGPSEPERETAKKLWIPGQE